MTTVLWFQMMLSLLWMLPPAAVGAVGGEGLGRIRPPPPPPPPPRTLQQSSPKGTTTTTTTTLSSLAGTRMRTPTDDGDEGETGTTEPKPNAIATTGIGMPPPPPPPRMPTHGKDAGALGPADETGNTSRTAQPPAASSSNSNGNNPHKDLRNEIRPPPPPPPPPRDRVEVKAASENENKLRRDRPPAEEDEEASLKSNAAILPSHEEDRETTTQEGNARGTEETKEEPEKSESPSTLRVSRLQNHNQIPRPLAGEAPPSAVTSAFKGLWGRVERTLDDLASLEDTVAGRAQRLVNTAVTTASTASKLSPSKLRSLAQSGAAVASRATASGGRNVVPFARRKAASPSVSDSTSVPLQPYGQKFKVAIEEKERRQREQASSPAVYDVENGDKSKSISAKGGATSSPYQPPPSPPSSSSPPPVDKEPAPPSESDGHGHRQGTTGGNDPRSNPSRGAPLDGTGTHDRTRDPRDYGSAGSGMNHRQALVPSRSNEPQKSDHSRSSRIPWDTSASSNQQPSSPSRSGPSRPHQPSFAHGFDDDDDEPAWKRSLKKLVPPFPSLPNVGKLIPSFRRGSNDYSNANLDAWDAAYGEESDSGGGIFGFFKRSKSRSSSSLSSSGSLFRSNRHDENDGQPPLITSMLSRCDNGKNVSLLREADVRASISIGRSKAVLDLLCMVSIIVGLKILPGLDDVSSIPGSLSEILSVTLSKGGSVLSELFAGSWALFAFVYAYLFKFVQAKLLDQKTDRLASSVASSVKEESEYAQLYLRLMVATPMNRNLPDRLAAISKSQVASVVSKARLNSYVWIVLASLTFMTVSAVGPIIMAFSSTFTKIALLPEWRQWPVQWRSLLSGSSTLMQTLFHYLESHSAQAFRTFAENPLQFSFHLSMFASLTLCALLPRLEEKRALASATDNGDDLDDDDDDDDAISSSFESAEEWSRLGTSSASRLSMLSENGSVENALSRWRASHLMTSEESSSYGPSLSSILRLMAYTLVTAVLTGLPVVVSHLLTGGTSSISNALSIFQWDSLFDVSFVQIFLFAIVYQTLQEVIESVNDTSVVKNFQSDLVSTKHEIEESHKNSADFQFMGSVSPSAGIVVRDLWAAHATKRAWAVRGANLHCKNGEILAILGEDGNGKTRLLTTLAENLTFPPKRTTTTNKVRGLISVGGLEISKWNRKMLKRRLGILLSDVRVIADSASLFSGWTMEEILEPVDGVRSSNNDSLQRTYTAAEKSAMLLALKLTGLYGTLLARLPSKTSTIFTANEEDLRPESLKSRSVVLSPGEWSKLILARVLSQTIFDNDNALASNDKIENSLVGSILLLDEPTTMHSEVDEGQLFRDLRLTGAATVITTNKWSTGRFADQICVVKNGSIVEMGTHNELLARGPQQSLYAAKWHEMTMQ
eukprot:jgi/Psemu1/317964/estExt_fgenesh1_pm.C_370012